MPRDRIVVDRPVIGLYRMRLRAGAVWVPISIEPYGAEFSALVAIVNGERADLFNTWNWCAGEPIDQAEFDYLTDLNEHCERHEPDSPEANPRRRIDLDKLPPAF